MATVIGSLLELIGGIAVLYYIYECKKYNKGVYERRNLCNSG